MFEAVYDVTGRTLRLDSLLKLAVQANLVGIHGFSLLRYEDLMRVPHHVVYIASWLGPGQTVSESVKQKRLAKTCCKGRFMHISNGGAQQVSFCVAVREARESQTASAAVSGSTV